MYSQYPHPDSSHFHLSRILMNLSLGSEEDENERANVADRSEAESARQAGPNSCEPKPCGPRALAQDQRQSVIETKIFKAKYKLIYSPREQPYSLPTMTKNIKNGNPQTRLPPLPEISTTKLYKDDACKKIFIKKRSRALKVLPPRGVLLRVPLNRRVMSPKKVNVGVETLEEAMIRPFNETMRACKIPLRRLRRKKMAGHKIVCSEPKVQGNETMKVFAMTNIDQVTELSKQMSSEYKMINNIECSGVRSSRVDRHSVLYEKVKRPRFVREELLSPSHSRVKVFGKIKPVWFKRENDFSEKCIDARKDPQMKPGSSHSSYDEPQDLLDDISTGRSFFDLRFGESSKDSMHTVKSRESTSRCSVNTQRSCTEISGKENNSTGSDCELDMDRLNHNTTCSEGDFDKDEVGNPLSLNLSLVSEEEKQADFLPDELDIVSADFPAVAKGVLEDAKALCIKDHSVSPTLTCKQNSLVVDEQEHLKCCSSCLKLNVTSGETHKKVIKIAGNDRVILPVTKGSRKALPQNLVNILHNRNMGVESDSTSSSDSDDKAKFTCVEKKSQSELKISLKNSDAHDKDSSSSAVLAAERKAEEIRLCFLSSEVKCFDVKERPKTQGVDGKESDSAMDVGVPIPRGVYHAKSIYQRMPLDKLETSEAGKLESHKSQKDGCLHIEEDDGRDHGECDRWDHEEYSVKSHEECIGGQDREEERIGRQDHEEERIGRQDHEEECIGGQDHEEKCIGGQDHEEECIGRQDHEEECIGRQDHEEERIGRQDHEEKCIGAQDHEEECIGRQDHEKCIGGQDHEEECIGRQDHEEKCIGGQDHEEERIGRQDHEEKCIGGQDHEEERIGRQDHEVKYIGGQDDEVKYIGGQDDEVKYIGGQDDEVKYIGGQDDEVEYGREVGKARVNDADECDETRLSMMHKVYSSKSSRLLFMRGKFNKAQFVRQVNVHGVKSEGNLFREANTQSKLYERYREENRSVPLGAWRAYPSKDVGHPSTTNTQRTDEDVSGDEQQGCSKESHYDSDDVRVSDSDESCCRSEFRSSQLKVLSFQEVEETEDADFDDLEAEASESVTGTAGFRGIELSTVETNKEKCHCENNSALVRPTDDNMNESFENSVEFAKSCTFNEECTDNYDCISMTFTNYSSQLTSSSSLFSDEEYDSDKSCISELESPRKFLRYWGCNLTVSFEENKAGELFTDLSRGNKGSSTTGAIPKFNTSLWTPSIGPELEMENIPYDERQSSSYRTQSLLQSNHNGARQVSECRKAPTRRKLLRCSKSSPCLSPKSNGKEELSGRKRLDGRGRVGSSSEPNLAGKNRLTSGNPCSNKVLLGRRNLGNFPESLSPVGSCRRFKDLKEGNTERRSSCLCRDELLRLTRKTGCGDLEDNDDSDSPEARWGVGNSFSARSKGSSTQKDNDTARKSGWEYMEPCSSKSLKPDRNASNFIACSPKRQKVSSATNMSIIDEIDHFQCQNSLEPSPSRESTTSACTKEEECEMESLHAATDLDEAEETDDLFDCSLSRSISLESMPSVTSPEYLETKQNIIQMADLVLEHGYELKLTIPTSEETSPTPSEIDLSSRSRDRLRPSPKHQSRAQVTSKKAYMESLRARRNRKVVKQNRKDERLSVSETDVVCEVIIPLSQCGTLKKTKGLPAGLPGISPTLRGKKGGIESKSDVPVQRCTKRESVSGGRKPVEIPSFWEQQAKDARNTIKKGSKTFVSSIPRPQRNRDESFWAEHAKSGSKTLLNAVLTEPISPVKKEVPKPYTKLPPLGELPKKVASSIGIKPSSHQPPDSYDFIDYNEDQMDNKNKRTNNQKRSEIHEKEEEFSSPENVSNSHRSPGNKFNADSAYSSLNRKSPLLATRGEPNQSEVVDSTTMSHFERLHLSSSGSDSSLPPLQASRKELSSPALKPSHVHPSSQTAVQKMSKFCHECGSKFPLTEAKFCCECGVRRLLV